MKGKSIATSLDFHFKTLNDGTKIFYPQGRFGCQGYYISSPELEPKLRQSIRRFYNQQTIWSCAFGGALGSVVMAFVVINLWGFILIISLCSFLGWLHAPLYFAKFTKQMEPAHSRSKFSVKNLGRDQAPSGQEIGDWGQLSSEAK